MGAACGGRKPAQDRLRGRPNCLRRQADFRNGGGRGVLILRER
jgi:hypothetical protein